MNLRREKEEVRYNLKDKGCLEWAEEMDPLG